MVEELNPETAKKKRGRPTKAEAAAREAEKVRGIHRDHNERETLRKLWDIMQDEATMERELEALQAATKKKRDDIKKVRADVHTLGFTLEAYDRAKEDFKREPADVQTSKVTYEMTWKALRLGEQGKLFDDQGQPNALDPAEDFEEDPPREREDEGDEERPDDEPLH